MEDWSLTARPGLLPGRWVAFVLDPQQRWYQASIQAFDLADAGPSASGWTAERGGPQRTGGALAAP